MNYFTYVTDDAEIRTHPEDPVVVRNGEHNGIVTFEIKAYPPPNFEFCYNGTCNVNLLGRVQVRIDHNHNETMYRVEFIVYNMTEVDNRNVTLRITQTERDVNFSHTVMLFLPCKFVSIQYVDVSIYYVVSRARLIFSFV